MELDIRRRFSAGKDEGDNKEKLLSQMAEEIQAMTQSLSRIEFYLASSAGTRHETPGDGQAFHLPSETPACTPASTLRQPSPGDQGIVMLPQPTTVSGLPPPPRGSSPRKPTANGGGAATGEQTWNLRVRSKTAGDLTGDKSQALDMPERRKSTGSGYSAASLEAHMLFEKLGSSWPATVQMRSRLRGERTASENSSRVTEALALNGLPSRAGHLKSMGSRRNGGPKLPMDPNSRVMNTIDVLKFFVLLHDIIVVPYILAWDVAPTLSLLILEFIAATFWSIDFALSFLVGFYAKGELIMEFRAIFINYLRTWCVLDFTLLSADVTTLGFTFRHVSQFGNGHQRSGVFAVAGAFRILKLFRLIRFANVVHKLTELTKKASGTAQLMKIPLSLVVYNHLVACAWGVLGRLAPTDIGQRWLDHPVDSDFEFTGDTKALKDLNTAQQYAAAMHWTLAQMTPGPIDIVSASLLERMFNILVLVNGLLFGSMIVSQFSGHIMRGTMLKRDRTEKIDTVRKYLQQREVSPKMSLRVQKQVIQRLEEEAPLQVRDVYGFSVLSSALRAELLHEVRLPHLLAHPVFKMWERLDQRGVLNLCENAVEFAFMSPQDVLFSVLAEGHEAYMVMSGCIQYTIDEELADDIEDIHPESLRYHVSKGRWFCEPALWSHWVHVGRAEAEMASELLVLSASALMKELERDHFACQMMKHYGRSYHMRITSAMPPFTDWPNDAYVPYTDMSDLVGAEVSIAMLNAAIAQHQLTLGEDAHSELVKELRDEKCALRAGPEGGLERTVAVVALRLMDRDHPQRFLVELAKADPNKPPKVSWSMPGQKRAMSEVPQAAMRRLLWKKFAAVKDLIVLEKTEHEVVKMDSSAFGMLTTYQRSIYIGRCEDGYVHEELSWKLLLSAADRPDRLAPFDIYVAEDSKKGWVLWGWIDSETFSWGKTDAGAKCLACWLPKVDINAVAETLDAEGQGSEELQSPVIMLSPRRRSSRAQVNPSPRLVEGEPLQNHDIQVNVVAPPAEPVEAGVEVAQVFSLTC
mmetsp:Transcript_39561/g.93153  ORF Transcript_39561/g.93153 Transcript_39561/m.93153 type:complete len:1034 (+) Transcript_39561:135-3236(+)|eukprot:CAMPEP_0178375082 /NCGR_PEP_ID=MMETSP0689_2-20121128/2705_1 /TAXON_ID=160604 /ORGANISM="Amphidinium massartii, Strain CS-259" /LENGTH=1033 /DNA_ID=CAMNT_0019995065 /DNA_START=34 /DNA_END=3135 /DNA_ORIENTATION=-